MVLGLGAAVYGVQAVLRARAEETEGRAEVVLATATSRLSWFGSHLLCAGGGATVLVLAGATAVGAAAAPNSGVTFTQTLASSLVQLPAVLTVTAAAALLVGLLPRLSMLGWALVGVMFLVSLWGPILNLPEAVLDVSPFATPSRTCPVGMSSHCRWWSWWSWPRRCSPPAPSASAAATSASATRSNRGSAPRQSTARRARSRDRFKL